MLGADDGQRERRYIRVAEKAADIVAGALLGERAPPRDHWLHRALERVLQPLQPIANRTTVHLDDGPKPHPLVALALEAEHQEIRQ